MSLIEAILLGILQGATEFLPISSSGHLVLVPAVFAMTPPTLTLIAIVHTGTLLAVLIYFWRDIWEITTGVLGALQARRPMGNPEARLGWFIVAGTIPAAVAGLTLEGFFEDVFGTPPIAAAFLLVTAVLLVISERTLSGDKALDRMTWTDAIVIGLMQMLALFPGVSRSGSTIAGGIWRGLDRATAARYSFLLGIPAIAGAGVQAVVELANSGLAAAQLPVFVAAFLAAAVSGYACIHFLLTWLKQHSLYLFAGYCAAFGGLYLLITLLA